MNTLSCGAFPIAMLSLHLLALLAGAAEPMLEMSRVEVEVVHQEIRDQAGGGETSEKFETIRAHAQAWLSALDVDNFIMSSASLKETILDDWSQQKEKFQIVSVRKPDDYDKAGHIPHAANTYWVDSVKDENIASLDPNKTIILYCYYGHGSMISSTILSLLGYQCRSLNFGMMGWNLDALVKEPWDQKADYDVEVIQDSPEGSFPSPAIESRSTDARAIIREQAAKYLAGEGSPVIASADVKAIVDDWQHSGGKYQILDVRSEREYEIGHVPHAINIPLVGAAEAANLRKLDPNRTVIVYSENGQTGQLATTVLSLLGYRAIDMKFGMMDWNTTCVEKSRQWNGPAGYPVERSNQL
ncbi:MAG: rhodanese-like domain-containing protein [Acidobacteriota bacterium]